MVASVLWIEGIMVGVPSPPEPSDQLKRLLHSRYRAICDERAPPEIPLNM